MARKSFFVLAIVAVISFAFSTKLHDPTGVLSIGHKAPKSEVKMKDISGAMVSLSDVKMENGLLVIFSCNTCPFVVAWEDRYPELGKICAQNKIGMVLVNSNEAKRGDDDSFEAMQAHAEEKHYNTYYTVDEKSALANAFGAKTTPHVFLFDKELRLTYKGAIDDNHKNKNEVKEEYLKNAIQKQVEGKAIDPNSTRNIGCSIKRITMK